jgi:hypothetical protein
LLQSLHTVGVHQVFEKNVSVLPELLMNCP